MSLLEALLLDPVRIDVWVAIRAAGTGAGSGTQVDPYSWGSIANFDALMSGMAPNTCVHLGPGEFQTAGFFDGSTSVYWRPKTGMRIVGSGIGATTLKLVNSAASNQRVYAVATPLRTPLVTAVTSFGSLRNNYAGWAGFQFVVGDTPLMVTELGRWVVSGNSQSHTVKLFNADGTAVPNGSVTVNTSGQPAGQFAYATLATPVTLAAGTTYALMSQEFNGGDQWYDYANTRITLAAAASGVVGAYSANPPPYTTIGAGQSYGPVNLRYGTMADYFELSDLTIDCNLAGVSGASSAAGAVRILGNQSRVVRVKVINWGVKANTQSGFVIAMLTGDPASGVSGVTNCGIQECLVVDPHSDTATGGMLTALHCGGKEDATSPAEAFGLGPYIRNCYVDCGKLTNPLSYDIRALSMAWCKGGVVEGNQVHNTRHGGPFQQTTHAHGLTIRGNVYRNVNKGPFLGGLGGSQGSGSLTRSGTVVTVSLGAAHALSMGDYVLINTNPVTVFDGLVVTVTGTTSTTFTFNTSITSASSANVSSVKKVFGVRDLLVEGNTVELPTATTGELIGIHVQDWSTTAPDATYPTYVFGKVAVRGNRIRYVDGAFELGYAGYGVQANGVQNLLVSENAVEAVPANPVRHNRCSAVRYFENRTPAGVLVRGYNESTGFLCNELETDAEDAFILGWLRNK